MNRRKYKDNKSKSFIYSIPFSHKVALSHSTNTSKSQICYYVLVITKKSLFIMMGVKKWAQYPTCQAQSNGGLHTTPKPLHISPKQRPGSLGPMHDLG